MPDTPFDPVDHSRTARRFTGEAMKNTRTSLGLALSAVGLVALVCGLYLLAVGQLLFAAAAGAVTLILGAAGASSLLAEHRRVVRHEYRWLAEHPHVPPEPPTG